MEVRWGVADFRQWLWVMLLGEWQVHVHVCNSHRQDPSDKAWSVRPQVQREWGRLGRRVNGARGKEGGRERRGRGRKRR